MAAPPATVPARVVVPAVAERFRVPRAVPALRLMATSFQVASRWLCGLRCRPTAATVLARPPGLLAAWWVPQSRAQASRQPSLPVALRRTKPGLCPPTRKALVRVSAIASRPRSQSRAWRWRPGQPRPASRHDSIRSFERRAQASVQVPAGRPASRPAWPRRPGLARGWELPTASDSASDLVWRPVRRVVVPRRIPLVPGVTELRRSRSLRWDRGPAPRPNARPPPGTAAPAFSFPRPRR